MVSLQHLRIKNFKKPLMVLAALASFAGGCQNEQRTQEMVQARFDAEKVKELSEEVAELKKLNDSLKQENESLKSQIHTQTGQHGGQAQEPSRTKVALTPKPKPKTVSESSSKPKTPEAQAESASELKKAATGGSSFK